jgi:hypothetical protein
MPFPEDIELQMLKAIRPHTRPRLHINPAEVVGIVETVRNIILNWTLKLEEEGILWRGNDLLPERTGKSSHQFSTSCDELFWTGWNVTNSTPIP